MKKEQLNKIKQLIEKWRELKSFIELLKKEETEIYIVGRDESQFPTTSFRVPLEDKEIIKKILRKKEIKLESIWNEIAKLTKNEPTKMKNNIEEAYGQQK